MELGAQADENYERRYRLKALGYDISSLEVQAHRVIRYRQGEAIFWEKQKAHIRGEEPFLLFMSQRAWGEHDTHGTIMRAHTTSHWLFR
jgi:hypothetical protein